MLYIPRGYWHEVAPIGEPTLHLSFAAQPSTGYDWLSWILQKTLSHQDVRSNIPFHEKERMLEYPALVLKFLSEIIEKESLEDFIAHKKGSLKSFSKFSFPQAICSSSISNDDIMRCCGFSAYIIDDPENAEQIIVGVLDKNWRFRKEIKNTISHMIDKTFTLSDLEKIAELNLEEIKELTQHLLSLGFIEIINKQKNRF